ncbi:hypothetical protein ALC56_10618, partial [Trachymyrmex septentrionalis]
LDRTREERRGLDESVPVRASLFIRALQSERSRDEIFLRTEESHNETGPFLIGPFHPIKNELSFAVAPVTHRAVCYFIPVCNIKLRISKETYNGTNDTLSGARGQTSVSRTGVNTSREMRSASVILLLPVPRLPPHHRNEMGLPFLNAC